jgi:hypothetical protein
VPGANPSDVMVSVLPRPSTFTSIATGPSGPTMRAAPAASSATASENDTRMRAPTGTSR